LRHIDCEEDDVDLDEACLLIGCGDLQVSPRRMRYVWQCLTPRAQLIKLHGGGSLLDPLSPANRHLSRIPIIMDETRIAVAAKAKQGIELKTAVLAIDHKCGVHQMHVMRTMDVLRSAIHAKEFYKDALSLDPELQRLQPGVKWKVVLLFNIFDLAFLEGHRARLKNPNADGLTYYFGRKRMSSFLDTWKDGVAENELVTQ
jgi:hypothetical protein